MRMQDRQLNSFFKKTMLLVFSRAKSWLAFLYPPIPVQSEGVPHSDRSERSDAKLPGLTTWLWLYQKRSIEAGTVATFGGLIITLVLSWIWPFLVGSVVNGIFIAILLRYRSQFQSQYPIIARQCVKNVVWLVFLEAVTIGSLAILIFGEGQIIHWI